jgi:S-adenosylmethionine synthetase
MNKMASFYVFTSESVTEGHPDKLCDQISDALVGNFLLQDPQARVIAECAASTGILFVSVKANSSAVVDVPNTAREVILDVGYDRGDFNGHSCTVMTSQDVLPVENGPADERTLEDDELDHLVALDNVTVFGYACDQTPELLPLPISLAHQLVRRLDCTRRESLTYLAPDGNCQVGIAYEDHTPRRIDSITLVASQRKKKQPDLAHLRHDLLQEVIRPVFAQATIAPDKKTRITINPEGRIIQGGPALHAGLTGRKNHIDTYGGYSRQSGAALSGKDPTRIDRVGSYAARHAARNIVTAGLARQCEVQLSYSIGLAAPVSLRVETFGTSKVPEDEVQTRVADCLDFRLGSIIRRFDLRRLARRENGRLYRRLSVYGHVGRVDLDLPWEKNDLVVALGSPSS